MEGAVKPCMRLTRKKRDYIVVSVGGSLIVPKDIDLPFLHRFRALLKKKIQSGSSFFIIAGGGKLARNYQEAAKEVRAEEGLEREDADWLGIHSTRLNAHLLRTLFKEDAQSKIVKNYDRKISPRASVIIGAGWKPGWSTDYDAVIAAKHLGAKKLVNLSNIDYVYTADPRKDPTATKIEKIGWAEFRKLIPEEWDPGLSSPFDPVAAKEAEALGLEVVIMNGAKLEEFENYLEGRPFIGTVIS
ncbi:MAG: uridylate kinase [Parcubacteria bacterium C7867-004]|nr:MAG: uridylate kinase [Parcubacteria bacterium C7867-004]